MSSPPNCLHAPTGFVVAIDGPAGAGKSTAARLLAERLGFSFLDTGAMYRCVTLAVLRAGLNASDESAVAELARTLAIQLVDHQVYLNGHEVTEAIRAPEVSAAIGAVADNRQVRDQLSQLQRQWAANKWVVTEGRDQGTVVFFDAPCKIFLTASDHERARRRCDELKARGLQIDFQQVLTQQQHRDAEDYGRTYGGLRVANDALVVMTDGMTPDEVIERLVAIVHERVQLVNRQPAHSQSTSDCSEPRQPRPISLEGRP